MKNAIFFATLSLLAVAPGTLGVAIAPRQVGGGSLWATPDGQPRFRDIVQQAEQCYMAAVLQLLAGHRPQVIVDALQNTQYTPTPDDPFYASHAVVTLAGGSGKTYNVLHEDGGLGNALDMSELFDDQPWWVGAMEVAIGTTMKTELGEAACGGNPGTTSAAIAAPGKLTQQVLSQVLGGTDSSYSRPQGGTTNANDLKLEFNKYIYMIKNASPDKLTLITTTENSEVEGDIFTGDGDYPPKYFVHKHTYGIGGYNPATDEVTLWNPWGPPENEDDPASFGDENQAIRAYPLADILPYIFGVYQEGRVPRCIPAQTAGGRTVNQLVNDSLHLIRRQLEDDLEDNLEEMPLELCYFDPDAKYEEPTDRPATLEEPPVNPDVPVGGSCPYNPGK